MRVQPLRQSTLSPTLSDPKHSFDVRVATIATEANGKKEEKSDSFNPKIAVLRLDYFYPVRKGDVDSPDSFDFPMVYETVEGLTFACSQKGLDNNSVLSDSKIAKSDADAWNARYGQERKYEYSLEREREANDQTYLCYKSETIERSLRETIRRLLQREGKNIIGITGNCGFFMSLQDKVEDLSSQVAEELNIPAPDVMMSSLLQVAFIQQTIGRRNKLAIVTANSKSFLKEFKALLPFGARASNIVVVGMEDVEGFGEEVEKGWAVQPCAGDNIVEKLRMALNQDTSIKGILMECTELSFVSDRVRAEFEMVVVDSLTMLNYFYRSRTGGFLA
eukprot:jgi/Psemu1/327799/estExt_fgenesh1_pg.C_8290001